MKDPREMVKAELDLWTARAEGLPASFHEMYGQSYCRVDTLDGTTAMVYEPSTSWAIAGQIMARQRYTVYPVDATGAEWVAEAQQNAAFHEVVRGRWGPEAICRLRVMEAKAAGLLPVE